MWGREIHFRRRNERVCLPAVYQGRRWKEERLRSCPQSEGGMAGRSLAGRPLQACTLGTATSWLPEGRSSGGCRRGTARGFLARKGCPPEARVRPHSGTCGSAALQRPLACCGIPAPLFLGQKLSPASELHRGIRSAVFWVGDSESGLWFCWPEAVKPPQ